MDSLTQAALGGAIGEAMFGKKMGSAGAISGAIIATIPDMDVFFLPFFSDLERISIHRGVSHSILFSILAAFGIAFILSQIKTFKLVSLGKLWLLAWLALFTHVLLDTFTTYGTQLFLPFSDYRVSFDSINIVDLIYTLPLVAGLLGSTYYYRNSNSKSLPNYLGLAISTLYLLFTLGAKRHVKKQFRAELAEQDITYFSLLTVPVKFGSLNWYGVAKSDSGLYIGKYSEIKHGHVSFEYFPTNEYLLEGLDLSLVDRLKWFAQGYYTVAKQDGKIRFYNLQCDMQGVRIYGRYKVPTAFYFEIQSHGDGRFELNTGMHKIQKK